MVEVGVLQTLDHPNIVDYLETYEDTRYIYLFMENCPGGELLSPQHIKENAKELEMNRTESEKKSKYQRFTESETRKIMYDLLGALAHSHA